MKFVNKSWILIPGLVLATASCTDLDTQPEGGNSTSDQKQEIAEAIPERVAADLSGMYFSIGKQYCVYGEDNPRAGYNKITVFFGKYPVFDFHCKCHETPDTQRDDHGVNKSHEIVLPVYQGYNNT